MRLKDKVAVVTGASSGIGREIAHTFARAGAKVVITDLDPARAKATAAELNGVEKRAIGVGMDLTSEAEVEAGMSRTVDAFGHMDILVSNPGIQFVRPLEEFAVVDWKLLLAIHLDGAFLTTRAALRQMYKQGGGSIIYIGSAHSTEASLLTAPYVTAQHGLIGLAKVVAKEGAKYGVRANVICPGFVRTPLVDKQIRARAKKLGISVKDVIEEVMPKDAVDGELTTVQDVAEAALFFASFEPNSPTGQSLVVSHGRFMQ
jgi:3-hydroxybutyrate dehydrogenase